MAADWAVRTSFEAVTLEGRAVGRIRQLIADGIFRPGDQLPGEPELARRLAVSRATLRSAVTELVADRLLVRRRGVGTFVSTARAHLSHGLERLVGTAESIVAHGKRSGAEGLRVRHETADDVIADRLGVDRGEPVVHISRTRTADDVPVLQCEEWLPVDLLPSADALDTFSDDDSLYAEMSGLGLAVTTAVTQISPVLADGTLRKRLRLPSGSPVLLLEQQHHTAGSDRVVLFSRNYYNCDLIDVHTVRRV